MQRVYCYYRQHFMMTAKDRAEMMARFVAYSQQNGLELAGIFTDTVDSETRGFAALRVAASMEQDGLVAVPALLHLAPLGDAHAVVRELAVDGATVVTLPLHFDQGPARATLCETSPRGRSLTRRPGTSLTTVGRRTGPPPNPGERARSNWAVPRSPFHSENPMRGSRVAPLPSSPSGALGRGQRELLPQSGETGVAPPVASTAGARGGATTVLVLEATSVSPRPHATSVDALPARFRPLRRQSGEYRAVGALLP
jgi:hypothetical protein